MQYPKIQTLYKRDPVTFKILDGQIRLPEFANIINWWVTEKIHGMNIRIIYRPKNLEMGPMLPVNWGWEKDGYILEFRGRTNKANIQEEMLYHLKSTFSIETMAEVFPNPETFIVVYGEGYGAKIQKGGGNYRPNASLRIFDIRIGNWWLEPDTIADIASKLGIKTVPALGIMTLDRAVKLVKSKLMSRVAKYENFKHNHPIEGIVARSHPLVLMRDGYHRVIWKLKIRDFAGEVE